LLNEQTGVLMGFEPRTDALPTEQCSPWYTKQQTLEWQQHYTIFNVFVTSLRIVLLSVICTCKQC